LPRLPSHSFAIFVIASFAIPTPQPIYVTTSRQSGIRFWTVPHIHSSAILFKSWHYQLCNSFLLRNFSSCTSTQNNKHEYNRTSYPNTNKHHYEFRIIQLRNAYFTS
jgi:hypothetical protein